MRSASCIPWSKLTPGRTLESAKATPWNVLWSSFRTMTRQGLPSPVPPPRLVRSLGGVAVAGAMRGPYQGPIRRCATLRPPGRIAQRESARFTRERSLVRSQVRPLSPPLENGLFKPFPGLRPRPCQIRVRSVSGPGSRTPPASASQTAWLCGFRGSARLLAVSGPVQVRVRTPAADAARPCDSASTLPSTRPSTLAGGRPPPPPPPPPPLWGPKR